MSKGQSFNLYPFRVVYNENVSNAGLHFCISVAKRHFKKAVDRNKIKRLVRECLRHSHHALSERLIQKKSGLDIMLIYTAKEKENQKKMMQVIMVILNRLTTNNTSA